MQYPKLYRILTYILIPCSFIALFFALFAGMMALSNPQMLIIAFFLACVVIYTFKSARFLFLNVQKNVYAPNADKAWIKVNGFITLLLSFQLILSGIMILRDPSVVSKSLELFYASVPADQAAALPGRETMTRFMRNMAVLFLIYGSLQALHVFMTLSVLKKYAYLFSGQS